MSYTNLNYHIVFSTKGRRPILKDDVLTRICQYIAGIIHNQEGASLAVNGMPDHIHIATIATPKIAISDFVRTIKSNSSGWVHKTFPPLRDFAWQDGYAAFTVSRSVKDSVVAYIMNQQEHHSRMTFQEELIALLKKHETEYDERYIWA